MPFGAVKNKPLYDGLRVSHDFGVKAERYLKNGIREYWIVDPEEQTLSFRANRNLQTWSEEEGTSIASSLLPRLVIQVDDIFA